MAFLTRTTAREAFERAQSLAKRMKTDAQSVRTSSVAGTMGSSQALDLARKLYEYKTEFNVLKLVPGVQTYGQSMYEGTAYNVATEFTAMLSALDDVTAWLLTNFPKTPTTNELRAELWNADNSGRTVDVVFTAAATAPFRTVLDSLIAAVE